MKRLIRGYEAFSCAVDCGVSSLMEAQFSFRGTESAKQSQASAFLWVKRPFVGLSEATIQLPR